MNCKEAGWYSGFHTAMQILKEFWANNNIKIKWR